MYQSRDLQMCKAAWFQVQCWHSETRLLGSAGIPACDFFWLKYLKTGLAINLVGRVNRYDSLLFLRWHYASHPTWSKLAKLVKRWSFAQMYLLSLVTKVIIWVPILAHWVTQIQQVTKMALTCGMIWFTRWGRPVLAYQDCELLASRNTLFVNKRALKSVLYDPIPKERG